MATGAETNTAAVPSSVPTRTALSLLVGLGWGALMLLVFGLWMQSKYEGQAKITTNIFLIAAAAAALLAGWQAFTLWFKKESPPEKVATLEQQRRIFSYIFLAAGIGLILMAFAVGFEKKGAAGYSFAKENFAETFGAILFGLIALGAGYVLQQPDSTQVSPIQLLLGRVPMLKMILIIIGAAAFVGFGYLVYQATSGSATGAVTNASNATPIVITTDAPSKLETGNEVTITGVAGNKAANGKFTVTVVTPTMFELDGATGNGEYAGGGTWTARGVAKSSDLVAWFPELLGLLSMSVLCVGCFLWLNAGQFDEFGIRLFVLVFGGATGVILFVMIVCRAYLWRQDIIFGGTAAWQGPNAWHFWLSAYVLFVALVLMAVSFNLARADIRTNVVLRRVMYGYDAIAQGMLLLGILTILNIVVYALVPFTFDWTKARGTYSLADSSKGLLSGLKQETNVIVLLPQNSKAYKDTRSLLDNCVAMTSRDRMKVSYLSPDVEKLEWLDLAKKFPAIIPDPVMRGAGEASGGRGVLIVYGAMPKDEKHTVAHAFVPERKLFDEEPARERGGKGKFIYKGEGEILKELKFLDEGRKKRKIYILQGNDEVDMTKQDWDRRTDLSKGFAGIGISKLVDRFDGDNYDVVGLSFGTRGPGQENPKLEFAKEDADKKKNIPEDCHTLIIAGVSKPLPKETLLAIERFMDHRNGRLLVYVDVIADADYTKMQNSGLEELLKRYGVDISDEFMLQLTERGGTAQVSATPPRSENVLAKSFAGKSIAMRMSARVVRPAVGSPFKGETILQVETAGRFIFVEKDVKVFNRLLPYFVELAQDPVKRAAAAAKEPIPVGVAASDKDGKPRVVVFGDTEMITNFDLAASSTQLVNYSMTVSALEWMAGREEMSGIQPNLRSEFVLDASVDALYWRMVLLPGWLMNLAVVGLGIGIWLVRRR